MIPYSTQYIDNDDIKAVKEVLESPFLTTGPCIENFEKALCSYTGAKYATAVNSATSALHLAIKALGIKNSDIVYVSAISFVASANCALYEGAQVEFVDVNEKTGNLDVDALSTMLERAHILGTLPKALVCVHLSGRSCDMKKIKQLSDKYGFYIIEDAAHAIGAIYNDTKVGSCTFSDITVFSFHPVKIITTGEGGMALTNNEKLDYRLKLLRSHGITHEKSHMQNKKMPDFYYEQIDLGFNYRMTDFQAALGLSQLSKIDDFLKKRRALAKSYAKKLKDLDITLPCPDSNNNLSSWHLYQIGIDGNRDSVYKYMRSNGIGVQIHYLPIYDHPYYQSLQPYPKLFGAESFFKNTLSIPLFVNLDEKEQDKVVSILKKALTL